jgi:hypothetical protein
VRKMNGINDVWTPIDHPIMDFAQRDWEQIQFALATGDERLRKACHYKIQCQIDKLIELGGIWCN